MKCVLDGGEVRPYWLHGEGEGCAERDGKMRREEQVRGRSGGGEEEDERRRVEQVREGEEQVKDGRIR